MAGEELPPWGRAEKTPTTRRDGPTPPRGWHAVLATFLALDLLLPLTALAAGDLSERPWWSLLTLVVLRYGLLVPGVVAYIAHSLSCNGPTLLCNGEPDEGSIDRALSGLALAAVGCAVHLGLSVTVLMTALSDGEPIRSSYLAVAGRPVQAHVTRISPSCLTTADPGCGRAVLSGPDGAPLGSIDTTALEKAIGPSALENDFPLAQDPLGLIDPQPIGPGGRVAVQLPLLGALLAGQWLATLGLLATLLRPRPRSRTASGPRPQ